MTNENTPSTDASRPAVGGPVERMVRPGSEAPRWYVVSRDGVATPCKHESDAKERAFRSERFHPSFGPYRAVCLVESATMEMRQAYFWRHRALTHAVEIDSLRATLGIALVALEHHRDQTRPIGLSDEAIQALRLAQQKCNVSLMDEGKTTNPVGWRYVPSDVWGDQVLTQNPKTAELARQFGREVEPLYTGAQLAAELERIAGEPPISGNNLAQARVLMAAETFKA